MVRRLYRAGTKQEYIAVLDAAEELCTESELSELEKLNRDRSHFAFPYLSESFIGLGASNSIS